ncbi:MAG: DUF418 domain-containing protein, partial [Bacteroidota bacterium]
KFGFDEPIDRATRFWVYFLTQGKFYNMFALLFGVGFYMFIERLEKKSLGLSAMDIYARRLLWLFVIGVAHAYLIWSGDVLYHYAICGLLLFPFRSIRSRYLFMIITLLGFLLIIPSYDKTIRFQSMKEEAILAEEVAPDQRTEEEVKSIERWEEKLQKLPADTTYHAPPKATYWIGLQETYSHASVHKGTLYYSGLLFRSLIAMLLGIIFYRSGIFSDYRNWKYYWPITLTLLIIALAINYDWYRYWTYNYFNPVTSIWRGLIHTFPKETLGIAYILVLNGLYQEFSLLRKATGSIASIGRTALSNYIFQNILLGLIFYGYGFSQFNQWSRFELIGFVVAIWIVQILMTSLWLRNHEQGPLEKLWRRLTYSSFQSK